MAGSEPGGSSAGGTESGVGGSSGGTMAGKAGSEAGQAGAGGATTPPRTVVVLYADYAEDDVDPKASAQIRASFDLVNVGTEDVPLSELKLRYYYALENASEQGFECDYAFGNNRNGTDCNGTIQVVFGQEGDDYAEVSFSPPVEQQVLQSLGGHSGVIRLRFFKTNFSLQDQTNDYSFAVSDGVDPVTEHDHVTLHRAGELIYGVEPR